MHEDNMYSHLSLGPARLQSPSSSSSAPLCVEAEEALASLQLSLDIDRENSRLGDVGPSSNARPAVKPRSNPLFSLESKTISQLISL